MASRGLVMNWEAIATIAEIVGALGVIASSICYVLIIRMFASTKYFPDYWQKARGEFNEAFATYVDKQIEIVAADA